MNKRDPILNRQTWTAVILIAAFYPLAMMFRIDTLIILLNGVLFGCLAALVVAFGQLFMHAIEGLAPYNRVRQMTLGWFLNWVVIGGGAASSFYIRAADLPTTSLLLTAILRYVAIISAVLQVTAPDFGLGIFHGRDRKVLWTSATVGLAIAAIAIWIQANQMLVPYVRSALDHFAFAAGTLS